jgi:hypothetical protein
MKRVYSVFAAMFLAAVGLLMSGCTLESSPYGYGNSVYYDNGYSPYYYPAYRPYHYRYYDEHRAVHDDRHHHDDGIHVDVR